MSHHLPVAVHVARREAGRMIAGGLAATASWDRFLDGLMRGVLGRYGSGRKLSAEGLAAVAADVRAALVGLSIAVRRKVDPMGVFASDMARRLELL